MNAMILAAGMGTRLKPLTDSIPKALVKVGGKTLLELSITKLLKHGFNNIIINVHHFSEMIISCLKEKNNFGANVTISDEKKFLLDTGGGLKKIAKIIDNDKPILIYNVDIITDLNLVDLYKHHSESPNLATLAVRKRKTNRYLLFDRGNVLCGWINKTTKEEKIVRDYFDKLYEFAFSGIQVVNPDIFNLMPRVNKFSIIDLYLKLAPKFLVEGYDHTISAWIDVGKLENLKVAEKLLRKIRNNDLA